MLTIFRETAPDQLTVSIRGVTITGGVNDSEPDPQVTFGGGIWIPVTQLPAPPFNGTGATVTIADSVITGNTVTSREAIPPFAFCGPLPCGFNTGGGIDNGGVLTITNSRITNNTAGIDGDARDARERRQRRRHHEPLRRRRSCCRRSVVSGNRAAVSLPNGQAAGAGGIGSDGALTIEDSVVSDNGAELVGVVRPGSTSRVALAGGILVGECCGVSHRRPRSGTRSCAGTARSRTSAMPKTLAVAFGGGILAEAPLLLERAVVTDNLVRAVAGGDARGRRRRHRGRRAPSRSATAWSRATRSSPRRSGAALAEGGGIANAGELTLERTLVLKFNRRQSPRRRRPAPVRRTVGGSRRRDLERNVRRAAAHPDAVDGAILGNRVDAPAGFVEKGGGLYTTFPVSRTRR